jgi:hypothetical protein
MLRSARFVALLAVALSSVLLSACVTPREGGSGDPAEGETTREALAAARARWEAAGPDAYQFVFTNGCFCPEDVRGPFTLTVRDGAVAEVRYQGRPVPVDTERHLSVEAVFDRLEAAFDRDADAVRVTYDAALGYPVTAYVDYEAMAADEEDRFELRDLVALGG